MGITSQLQILMEKAYSALLSLRSKLQAYLQKILSISTHMPHLLLQAMLLKQMRSVKRWAQMQITLQFLQGGVRHQAAVGDNQRTRAELRSDPAGPSYTG